MASVLAWFAAGGCMVAGRDYEPPPVEGPEAFVSELERGLVGEPAALGEWWTLLGDEALDALVQRALESNLDLREALWRIQEARALRGAAATALVPTVDVTGDVSRSQNSRETPAGDFLPRNVENFALGLETRWELDLWGRIRRSVEAADAEIEVGVENARAVLVSVLAETAASYVQLREFQERARIARANIELQGQTVELTQNQFEAGLVSQLDVAQARTNLESTRAALPPLEAEARAARNRLAVLLGAFPGELEEQLAVVRPIPVPPDRVAVGVPTDVVRRRPDVRRAERTLAARTAQVGVAAGDLYPTFSLTGSLGYQAEEGSDLFRTSAAVYSIGPSVRWNVFDRRRIRNQVRASDARVEQALTDYERTVLGALEEVENAMTRFVREQDRRDALATAVAEARRAVELSRDQYRQGLVSFQSVLDTERRLFALEDVLATSRAAITTQLITLYRALGGGWESRDIVLQQNQETP